MDKSKVITFPDPYTVVDENGKSHKIHFEQPRDEPTPEGYAWHGSMGDFVPAERLNHTFETYADEFYQFHPNPWQNEIKDADGGDANGGDAQ